MQKVGITGQAGFLGTHLYNTLGLYPEKYCRIPFKDEFFSDHEKFNSFVSQCDVIVHLAAVNRHHDPDYIYSTNIQLTDHLIKALDKSGRTPHVLYSSSIQEDLENPYGKSKKAGREMLAEWADRTNSLFTGFVFSNIFGPFGQPYFNSFIATFSHQLTHNETPKIDSDNEVPLLYVSEVVRHIIEAIDEQTSRKEIRVSPRQKRKVSDVLKILELYKKEYFEKGIIPYFKDLFEVELFNTFRSYIDVSEVNPVRLIPNTDNRGSFVETIKTNTGGQFSFSTTKPGITRGNHFHARKIERFMVIKGKARIQLRRIGSDEIHEFFLSGDNPSFVDMPVWYTHNITNTGTEELYTLFWINEFYNPEDPDTFFEKV